MSNNYSIATIKFSKILGWFLLIAGILSLIINVISFASWNLKKGNYSEEYVYSDFGNLYYETDGKKIYVQNIYNTDNEKITLNVPNKETVLIYINKDNISDGIYFDLNNTIDQSMLNPTVSIFVILFLIIAGLLFIQINKKEKEKKVITNPSYLLNVLLFSIGIATITWQLHNAFNYFNLKNENNITTATIYSEIYNIGAKKNLFKPVSYYYVDNQKYIYVNDSYIEGNLEDNIGKTFELYYNENNPNKVSKKENPIDVLSLIIGICFLAFIYPVVKKIKEKK